MNLVQRNEKGFTLIETVMVVAIMGIFMLAMTMTITNMLTKPQLATDHNVVLQQAQNAGYWISRDVQTAKNLTLNEPNGFPVTLDIPVDLDDNNDISVDYIFDGNKLKRQVYDSSHTLTAEALVAEYIDVANTTFINVDSDIYDFTVKVSKGEIVVERYYKISQRPNSS